MNDDGELIGYQGVDSDITDRKLMEEQLQENQKRMDTIMMATPGPMVIYNAEGIPEYLNQAFTDVFGWTLDELEGRRIPFIPEGEKASTDRQFELLYSEDRPLKFETVRLTKSGRALSVIVSAACIRDNNHIIRNIVATLTDIFPA